MKNYVLLLVALIALSGCAREIPKVWTDIPTAESLLAKIRSTEANRHSLDTEAKVSLASNGKYFATHQFILVQRPRRLRTDVLTGFGQLIMQVAVDNGTLSAFLNDTVPGRFYHGAATQENLSRFVHIPLQISDLIAFLLYTPPVIAHNFATVDIREDMLILGLTNGEQRQEIEFDPSLRASMVRYYRSDVLQLQVEYDDFNAPQGFPRRLKITLPEEQVRISVAMEQPLINAAIADDRFSLSAPKGALKEIL